MEMAGSCFFCKRCPIVDGLPPFRPVLGHLKVVNSELDHGNFQLSEKELLGNSGV